MRVIKEEDRKVHLSSFTSNVRHPDDKAAHVLPLHPLASLHSAPRNVIFCYTRLHTHVSHEASHLFMLTQYLLERIGASAHSHGSPSYFGQRRRKRTIQHHSFFLLLIFLHDFLSSCTFLIYDAYRLLQD